MILKEDCSNFEYLKNDITGIGDEKRGFIYIPNCIIHKMSLCRCSETCSKEFDTAYFVKSQPDLLRQLRRHEMFGDKICYYYDIIREDDFINFLVKKSLEKNPDPNREMRKVFMKLLHNHGLCWFGYIHLDKRYKTFESRGM